MVPRRCWLKAMRCLLLSNNIQHQFVQMDMRQVLVAMLLTVYSFAKEGKIAKCEHRNGRTIKSRHRIKSWKLTRLRKFINIFIFAIWGQWNFVLAYLAVPETKQQVRVLQIWPPLVKSVRWSRSGVPSIMFASSSSLCWQKVLGSKINSRISFDSRKNDK